MRIILKTILVIAFGGSISLCQISYSGEIGKFQSASAFSYSPAGFFFITDAYTNELIKLDTLGRKIVDIGGYGWQSSSFDNPVDVFSTTLNVYVADKNNNRIGIFDKDLNFITQFSNNSGDDEEFGYPLSCCVSTNGDLFILDGENRKVIKYDQNGRFLLRFGSFDSGDFILSDPKSLTITHDNKVVVLDNTNLVFFDQFGNGLTRLAIGNDVKNVNVTFNNMVITSAQKIFTSDLQAPSPEITNLILPGNEWDNIVEGLIVGNNLYLLTPKNILLFKIKKG